MLKKMMHKVLLQRLRLGLFWRTFLFVAVLLLGCVISAMQILRTLETDPRMERAADKIVSLVRTNELALARMSAQQREQFIEAVSSQPDIRLFARSPHDALEALPDVPFAQVLVRVVHQQLGPQTALAGQVNGVNGIWVGMQVEGTHYWVHLHKPLSLEHDEALVLAWFLVALVLSLAGAAAITHFINRPLEQLRQAMQSVERGDLCGALLPEDVLTSEVHTVNSGFNRMVRRLSDIERERQVMLAGISHDLRTPLARLRLETEMSVREPLAREHMAEDIEMLDAIIGKFLDYGRSSPARLQAVPLAAVVQECVRAASIYGDLRCDCRIDPDLHVLAEEVELHRVLSNLIENARRYGKTPGQPYALLHISVQSLEQPTHVALILRDCGPGVRPEHLEQLIQPFFRADAARSNAEGVGLGLCIVDKAMQRMGGHLHMENAADGGLQVRLVLQLALPQSAV